MSQAQMEDIQQLKHSLVSAQEVIDKLRWRAESAERALSSAQSENAGLVEKTNGAQKLAAEILISEMRLRKALGDLVKALDACAPSITDAFAFKQNHGILYAGPTYSLELEMARSALTAQPASQAGGERDAVIEECAKVCEALRDQWHARLILVPLPNDCATAIRALKSPAPEPRHE